MATRKTAPDRRAARFLSSTSKQAYRGDVFDRNPAARLAPTFFIYEKPHPPCAEAAMASRQRPASNMEH